MSAVIDMYGVKAWQKAAGELFAYKKQEGYQAIGLHLYRAADGSIVYARVRMRKATGSGPEKFIRPFWHDGTRWAHGEPKQESGKLLYGLTHVSAYSEALVVLTEGEQKADALSKIGAGRFIGVTSGSATSAGGADWSPLAGRDVLLWPDHDAPGQKYADEVRNKLQALGCSVSCLDVAAIGLPEAGDVMDWLTIQRAASDREMTADDVLALPRVGATVVAAAAAESQEPASEAAPTEGDSQETDDQTIERLAALKTMQYDRVRKAEAKRMNVQVSTLDKMVAAARADDGEQDGPFSDVEPWHEPVDGAALLADLTRIVHRFIICDEATAHGSALWITMTWLMDSVDVAPIAAITAPEKRCGKSQLLFLMGRLSSRPLTASNITPAALFRAIELWRPTLLIDEADAFMRENEELRGLLNCGHTRDSAYVVRTVGDDHTPKQFFVYGAKAIAGIGHLADTLMDRSIALELRRKLPHEQVDKLRQAEPGMFERLCAKLARWADDNAEAVRSARPALPAALHDRAADNWEPLLQIAEVAGGAWPDLAKRAALKLSGDPEQSQSTGADLLADIQEVFDSKRVQRISMTDLLDALLADEEKQWATWRGGKPMTPRNLSKKLGEYGIRSKAMRDGYHVSKGFDRDQFLDAFTRYLSSPADTPLPPVTQLQTNAGLGLAVTEAQLRNRSENPLVTLEPLLGKGCNRVTEENGNSQGKENSVADDESEEGV